MIGYILGSLFIIGLFIWLLFYGASLYDRRSNSTSRHRKDTPHLVLCSKPDELEEALDNVGE